MKLLDRRFTRFALDEAPATLEIGESASAVSRAFEHAGLRLRVVDYAAGYLADHWCDRGHVFYLMSGDATVELRDGRRFPLTAGQGFAVSDHGDAAHRVSSLSGGVAFIVD